MALAQEEVHVLGGGEALLAPGPVTGDLVDLRQSGDLDEVGGRLGVTRRVTRSVLPGIPEGFLDVEVDATRSDRRGGRDQLLRVRVLRVLKDVQRRAGLHDPALAHDDDALGALRRQAEVVGDQQHGGAELLGQLLEVVEDLLLDRHVERGGRFIGDEESRTRRQATGDECTLALTTGELVRELVDAPVGLGKPSLLHELDGTVVRRGTGGDVVGLQRLLDVVADAPHRVEVAHRVLGDQADLGTADPGELTLGEVGDVAAVEGDGAVGDLTATGQQPHDAHRGGGLARAGLAHHGDRLAGPDVEVDVEDRRQRILPRTEGDVDVAEGEQGRGCVTHRVRSFGSRASLRVSPSRMNPSTVIASAPAG